MGEEVPESIDLWEEIEDAERTLEHSPPWQRLYELDPDPERTE
jgi:hypothetical protein